MANPDSFISEVTEEVRRDRLFALLRRYGWIAALIIALIVGGASWTEYRRVQAEAAAQAFGDALITALDLSTPEERIAALQNITADAPEAQALLSLMLAGEEAINGEEAAAADRLRAMADSVDVAPRYRDLALLKAHLLSPEEDARAMAVLEGLSAEGAPYRDLALEQQAYLHLRMGDQEAGIALLRQLESEASGTPGLQQRASQLIVALEAGAVLSDQPLEQDAGATGTGQDEDAAGDTGETPDTDDAGNE